MIDLGTCQFVGEMGNPRHKSKAVFGIVSPHMIYYFMGKDENDMKRWMECVQQQMQLAKKRRFRSNDVVNEAQLITAFHGDFEVSLPPSSSIEAAAACQPLEETSSEDDMFAFIESRTGNETLWRQGYLEKASEVHQRWKRQWAVLRDDKLVLYKDEREYHAQQILPVKSDTHVVAISTRRRPYAMQMKTSRHKYLLAFESADERSDWLEAFHSIFLYIHQQSHPIVS
jgi:hypothetical protein